MADGAGVYVAMRRNDIRPQAHVACFDRPERAAAMAAVHLRRETPGPRNLPSKHAQPADAAGETLYYNTNLGAVAAVSTDGGRLLWVSLYPRARHGDLLQMAPHWQRDLTPCLYDGGTLAGGPRRQPAVFAPGRRRPARCSGG